jgi:hypothetical protein
MRATGTRGERRAKGPRIMTTTKRQTAGNNKSLASVKRHMNAKIYKRVADLYNAEGRDAARAWLGQFFNDAARERCLGSIFDAE